MKSQKVSLCTEIKQIITVNDLTLGSDLTLGATFSKKNQLFLVFRNFFDTEKVSKLLKLKTYKS